MACGGLQLSLVALGDRDPLELRQPISSPSVGVYSVQNARRAARTLELLYDALRLEMACGGLQLSLVALGDRDPLELRQPISSPFVGVDAVPTSSRAARTLELLFDALRSEMVCGGLQLSWSHWATLTLWSGATSILPLVRLSRCPKALSRLYSCPFHLSFPFRTWCRIQKKLSLPCLPEGPPRSG